MKKFFIHEYWDSRFKSKNWFDIRLNTGKMFYKMHDRYKIIVNGGAYGTAELVAKHDTTLMYVPKNVCSEGFDDFNLELVYRMLERIYAGQKEWHGLKTRVSVLLFRWIERYDKPVFLEGKK